MSSRLTIRETTPNDRKDVLAVTEAAFERADEAGLMTALWEEDAVALDLVAEENGTIIGHIAFTVVTAAPPLQGAALSLAPLSVAPKRQRSGVGSALAETGLEICKTRGASLMVVLGHPEYYPRFGFKPGSVQNIAWADMDAGDAFQIIDWAGIGKTPRKIYFHPAFAGV